MPRRSLRLVFLVFTFIALPFASAQTTTIPNPDGLGGSIVQVVTTDIDALPVTTPIETIPPGAVQDPNDPTTAATTATTPLVPTTAPPDPAVPTNTRTRVPTPQPPPQQGPVQQPAPTVPPGEGITTYQYTTVDALGETTIIHDTFTPTYNTPSPAKSPSAGTVLSPSDWSALIGTHTAGGPTSSAKSWRITQAGMGGMVVLGFGVAVGAWAVL